MDLSLKWSRAKYQPCLPLGENGSRITASQKHLDIARKYAAEGVVLLKNDGAVLPFKPEKKVALFGTGLALYVKSGGGSGDVFTTYTYNMYEALKQKEAEGKLKIYGGTYEPIKKYLDDAIGENVDSPLGAGRPDTYEKDGIITEEIISDAAKFTDTAVYFIYRYSAEEQDRTNFDLFDSEKLALEKLNQNFKKIVVVLNICGVTNVKQILEYNNVSSILVSWNGGTTGCLATADVLCGDVNPSGKLADTFADSIDSYPSTESFNESDDYVKYTEDIYVGYRYFETIPGAAEHVIYPFGFGLSYTTFEFSNITAAKNSENICIECDITNTGNCSGKEVAQVYYSAPQGLLGKPSRELACYKKTKELAPGECEHISLEFKISDMASFDDLGKICKSAFLLEKGEYNFYVGNSVRNTVKTEFSLIVNENTVTEQLSSLCAPESLEKRMLADGSFEELPSTPHRLYPLKKLKWVDSDVKAPEQHMNLIDVAKGNCTLDEFMAQFTSFELAELSGVEETNPNTGVANTWGIGNVPKFGVPNIMTADGPAGLRFEKDTGVSTTAWPIATQIACTWNPQAAYDMGSAAALEAKENNIDIWLSPSMNIHRSPLCGRNFEYYSEDPVIAGTMATACVKGVQSNGIAATIKHLCCNNKETNRKDSDSQVSERALREIYLKGFEYTVKNADPWLLMTSYNILNGIHTSANSELITGILRGEWGYKGAVTSDWWTGALAVFELKAGNDIKMPQGFPMSIEEAMRNCTITRFEVEQCARRILELILKLGN